MPMGGSAERALPRPASAAPYSVRRHCLTQVTPHLAEIGLKTPARFHVDWPVISAIAAGDAGALAGIVTKAKHNAMLDQRLIAHACPHDEGLRPDLSFAGVFQTYHPRRTMSQAQNIAEGVTHVLAGRHGQYADTYYARHRIAGVRAIDLEFANFVDRILKIGTAYVYGSRCLVQYFDSYLSLYANDPVRLYAERGHPARFAASGFDARLLRSLFAVAELLPVPLDIEFVVTSSDDIFVTQLRPISAAHRRAWESVSEATWTRLRDVDAPSVILNSVGRVDGQLVDLRHRHPGPNDIHVSEPIFVVRHNARNSPCGGLATTVLPFLDWALRHGLPSFALLVDHGACRHNDHLEYILLEDPAVGFVACAKNLPDHFAQAHLRIESDGFDTRLAAG